MKCLLLTGLLLLTVATLGSTAHAQQFEFDYTGRLVTFTVPINGTYQIIAFGAQGGSGNGRDAGSSVGSKGAEVGGNFNLTAGEILQIAVGGMGLSEVFGGGGGGGGSFVVGPGKAPLVIAGGGGGGGAGSPFFGVLPGQGGLTTPGDGNGGPGGCCFGAGGGGGGFFSASGSVGVFGTGAGAWPDLAGGSVGGGFGGGGGASAGGGGGGGYSGGGGGSSSPGGSSGGGGGLSDEGTDEIVVGDIWPGNGEVVITIVSPVFAGTPGQANCQGQSVSALAQQFGGIDAAVAALHYSSAQALQDAIMAFCANSNRVAASLR